MPHFTSITLDRLINTGDSRSVDRPNQCTTTLLKASSTNSKPWDYLRLEKRHSMPITRRPVMSPEHYATPESTPGPDLASLFPPLPHSIDHNCHEPYVVKKDEASNLKNTADDVEISADEKGSETQSVASESSSRVLLTASDSIISEHVNGAIINDCQVGCTNLENGNVTEEGNDDVRNGHIGEDGCEMPATDAFGRESDSEDLCDLHESMSSCTSHKDGEEFSIQVHSSRLATPTPGVEFYDPWEELSSLQNSVKAALEDELGEIRLSLAMETEKRKQAEEALENMQRRWERMREHLSRVGLTLPSTLDNETMDSDLAEEMVCQQVQVIRFVSESIGRGIAKAEAVTEMEYQVEAKNFDITRLCDRLHYYETMNRAMSQRKQEVAAEGTRRPRERRKWIWGSIGVTMSIGIVAVACNYLQTGKSSSTTITMCCGIKE